MQTSPSQMGYASAISCDVSSRGVIKNPATKSIGASTPNRTSHSDMNPVGVSNVSVKQKPDLQGIFSGAGCASFGVSVGEIN